MTTTKASTQARAITSHEEGFGLLEWTDFADVLVSKREKEKT